MDYLSFHLPDSFVESFADIKPKWGFDIGSGNTLSELTFITKYSMLRDDGTKERWFETCERVINGTYSILKDHAKLNGTHWNENKAQRSAKEAYERMFYFKWTPPGRGIENMGKAVVNAERNSAMLFNCALCDTSKLSSSSVYLATRPFVMLMEQSLNGIGCGYTLDGAGKLTLHQPIEDTIVHVIEDTREAWAESLGVLLESFFFSGRKTVVFDYSKIRPEGSPLGRAGGRASGPGPLKKMHEKISELLSNREGELITSMDIMDICNLAGKAVVSGGKRRSALLALGSKDDKEFVNAKNSEEYPERCGEDGWAHMSNNSVVWESGMDVSDLIDRIADNGEPGLVNLDLARRYGRLGDEPNNKDMQVKGVNPCSEATLEASEFCNLGELYLPNVEGREDFLRTIKFAYLYSKAVTLLPTPWPEVNEVIVRNRRIGTSVTGVTQYLEDHDWSELRELLDAGYKEIDSWDETYSAWLGVRRSIKTTVVKPSGSVSLVCAVTPGVHWPVTAGKYFRRQRFSVYDPMVELFKEAGYHIEPDVMDPYYTAVVTFPVQGPEMRDEKQVSLWEKAALAALMQRYWADQAVSVTLTFTPEEKDQVGPVVKAYSDQLKAMSFLPLDVQSYEQMPYEAVPESVWQAAVDVTSPIDWDSVYESKGTEAAGEKFCNNDHCVL